MYLSIRLHNFEKKELAKKVPMKKFSKININQKNYFNSKQDFNNLQSILRINNKTNTEAVWIKKNLDENIEINSSPLSENSKEFDSFLSKKSFYLDDTFSNLFDSSKDEHFTIMKKSKQHQHSTNLIQDKQNSRSSSLVINNNKSKLNKKVDFLDIKLNNCLTSKNKKITENNSLPSSSQSSPKSTLSNQNTNEDSFVDSNLSSSSSDVQSNKGSNQKITALTSNSSTSSGVGSSNVSSASSTTSETASTENLVNNKCKIAPKAIISDDGDIEIETPLANNLTKSERIPNPNRLSMRIIDPNGNHHDQNKYNNVYYVNAKNTTLLNNRYSQQISKHSVYNQHFLSKSQIQQNQLAAAAAAAAAMDKEKQRDALIEYVKSQQLQEHLQREKNNNNNNKNEIPNEFIKNLKKQVGPEISSTIKNERLSAINGTNLHPLNNINYQQTFVKTPARRDSCLGLCYLIYGPETKRTLLPSQVTGIDTVKALFVRAFADKLTMNYLDDEQSVKIYIKDQAKDLFYQVDDISDIKDKCVLKLVEITKPNNSTSSQPSNTLVQKSNQQAYNNYETSQPSKNMTQSQYCYSSLSDHQSIPAQYEAKRSETVSLNPRSLSEPRNQIKKASQTTQPNTQQVYQNPIYNQQSKQEYFLTNQDLINQTINSTVETYDNLDVQTSHNSRIESKYPNNQQINYYDRYNRSLNPIYNSMRVGSRDVRSVDRDVLYSHHKAPSTPRKISLDLQSPQLSRQSTLNDSTFTDSPSKLKNTFDADATEGDTISLPSSISIRGFKNFQNEKNLDLTDYDVECDDDDKTVNEEHFEVENFEESRLKIKMMQRQLETLTNLVHQALVNKDLNKLEDIAQTAKFNQHKFSRTNLYSNKPGINHINEKAKQLKNDLITIKKMHENFNSYIGESFKEFVKQINERLKTLSPNEQVASLKLDNLINKYNSDFSKIENELCDLETVVDDLRENILKHKFKVSIDDVECYALALSQLSKQLVNLKTSFSSIKDHFKQQNSINTENRFVYTESCKLDSIIKRCKRITGILIILKKLAISPPTEINKKQHQPPGLPPVPKPKSSSQDFINDIQSIKPDHEQRKLAIEVDNAFNQLMSEISMIAHDLIPKNKIYKNCLTIESFNIDSESDSLETDSLMSLHETKRESEATMRKRSKFRAQKNQLKEDRENLANSSSSSSNSSFGSIPSSPTYHSSTSSPLPMISSHMNGINIQTMPIPLAVPLNSQYLQNKSFLETVHEEEPNSTIDLANQRAKLDIPGSCDEEISNSVENQLYEQLSQFKPIKKNYKTSASICLINTEPNENSDNVSNVSTSMVIMPNNEINNTCSKLNVRFNENGQAKTVKSKIRTNGSMQRVNMTKNENTEYLSGNSTNSISSQVNEKYCDDKISNSSTELNSNGNKTMSISTILVPRRNADNLKNHLMSTSITLGSPLSPAPSCSSTPRRVSLSVTDL
ncbi:unnamed protein product [Brachionus calyciflorus]|uniref:Actin interacting protein 3-like C-terminal domain-containing protein n=1 Tax=Brachionus calyciflorus TaxID=104777 RepID=A0A813M6E6_9BILA|nr:unnamed protein product [Brachionus calyciflorus]